MTLQLAMNVLWAVTLWAMAASAAVLLMRRRRAVIRRDICRLGLIGTLVAVVGACVMHAWRPAAGLMRLPPPKRFAPMVSRRPVAEPAPPPAVDVYLPATVISPDRPMADLPVPVERSSRVTADVAPAAPVDWSGRIVAIVASVSVLLGAVFLWRVARLALWRRTWRSASPAWVSLTARLAERMGMRTRFSVYVAPGLSQPAAAGAVRPAIVLPDRQAQRIGPALRGALGHELGHLAGRDPLWGLIGLIVVVVAWWCPLVWWLHRRARMESELTADDCALESGVVATDLARTLIRLAERVQRPTPLAMAGMAGHLRRRIEMIINPNQPHNSKIAGGWRWLLALCASAAAVAVAAAPLVGTATAAEGRREERPAKKKADRERPEKRERGFVAAERIVCRARVTDGWLTAEARMKQHPDKLIWVTRLGRVERSMDAKVRCDGPFVVVMYGPRRFIINGETGQIIPPEALKAEARRRQIEQRDRAEPEREHARRREGGREREEAQRREEAKKREHRERERGEANRREEGEKREHHERERAEAQRREEAEKRKHHERTRAEAQRREEGEKREHAKREEAQRREGPKGDVERRMSELREQIFRLQKALQNAERMLKQLERARHEKGEGRPREGEEMRKREEMRRDAERRKHEEEMKRHEERRREEKRKGDKK